LRRLIFDISIELTDFRDGGIALTAFIDRIATLRVDRLPLLGDFISSAIQNKLNVIELGCGCGMVGIGLAQSVPNCNVILTDMPEAEEIATRNVSRMNPAESSNVVFVPLDWEFPLPQSIRSRVFDIILVSECTYNSDTIPALVQTISELNKRSPKACVLVSTKVRHSSESMFFELMHKADFVRASHTKLPLPKDESSQEDPEVVHVYVFHSRAISVNTIASKNNDNQIGGDLA